MPSSSQNSSYNREGISGSLINLILGGVMLWVGQTTFRHNGQLSGMAQQLEAVNERFSSLRDRHDEFTDTLNDRTKARFTEQDGEKLEQEIRRVELAVQAIKEHNQERLGALRLALASVDMSMQNLRAQTIESSVASPRPSQSESASADLMRQLQYEVDQLRSIIAANSASVVPFRQAGHSKAAYRPGRSRHYRHTSTASHADQPRRQNDATAYAR